MIFVILIIITCQYISSFFFTCFSLRVAWAAAPDKAATPLDQPTQTAFCLDTVPNGSNLDPQYNQAILFMVLPTFFVKTHFFVKNHFFVNTPNTDCISLGYSPKRFQPRSSM